MGVKVGSQACVLLDLQDGNGLYMGEALGELQGSDVHTYIVVAFQVFGVSQSG